MPTSLEQKTVKRCNACGKRDRAEGLICCDLCFANKRRRTNTPPPPQPRGSPSPGPKTDKRLRRLIRRKFGVYQRSARARGLVWTLDRGSFESLLLGPCKYCGRKDKFCDGVGYTGVDRVDNEFGYIVGNVVSCCRDCNWAKSDKTLSQWFNWLEAIRAHCG